MTVSTWCWLSSTKSPPVSLRRRERPSRRIPDLPALTQIMIGNDTRHHSLADRHGANADAGIVPALGYDFALAPVAIDGAARRQDRRGGFHDEARDDRLAG